MNKLPSARSDWLQVLFDECERTNQASVAKRLNVSQAAISQLLKGTYKADLSRMEARVRGELMNETHTCPVLGELSKSRCLEEQKKPYIPNPIRSQLFRTCPTCPFRIVREK